MTFDEWWEKNEDIYSRNSLHMSEYHMASIVWDTASLEERKACAKAVEALDIPIDIECNKSYEIAIAHATIAIRMRNYII